VDDDFDIIPAFQAKNFEHALRDRIYQADQTLNKNTGLHNDALDYVAIRCVPARGGEELP
jgi:hypothetical protein